MSNMREDLKASISPWYEGRTVGTLSLSCKSVGGMVNFDISGPFSLA